MSFVSPIDCEGRMSIWLCAFWDSEKLPLPHNHSCEILTLWSDDVVMKCKRDSLLLYNNGGIIFIAAPPCIVHL